MKKDIVFIIPEVPIRDENEDYTSWFAKCLHWYCRIG